MPPRKLSAGVLSRLVTRPGIDPRRWTVCARVGPAEEDVGYDAAEGYFANVTVEGTGESFTALIGSPYAGQGFGLYLPVRPNDRVLVELVEGSFEALPTITERLWDRGTPPPADGGSDEAPTQDVLLRVREGQNLRLRVAGAGGVSVIAEGDGDVVLSARGAGKVKLGEGTLQPAVLGQTLYEWMQTVENRLTVLDASASTVLAAYNLHTHVSAAPATPTSTTSAPATPSPPSPPVPPDVRAADTEVK